MKYRALLLAAVFLGGAVFAEAETRGTLEMGTEVSYFNYEEPGVMEEDGMMYGVYGSYDILLEDLIPESRLGEGSTLGFDALFKYGQVDYESPTSGTLDDIDDFMFEISGNWGYQFAVGDTTKLTPYIGLGYRYLNDDSSGKRTSIGHYGYERESNYFYLPIGVKTLTDLTDQWSIGLNAEFDVFLSGKQKSHLEDVASSLSTLENDQDKGYGVRGSLQLVRQSDRVDLSIEPFVRYWDIDESSVATINCGGTPCALGYEPKNESLDVGVRLGVQF